MRGRDTGRSTIDVLRREIFNSTGRAGSGEVSETKRHVGRIVYDRESVLTAHTCKAGGVRYRSLSGPMCGNGSERLLLIHNRRFSS